MIFPVEDACPFPSGLFTRQMRSYLHNESRLFSRAGSGNDPANFAWNSLCDSSARSKVEDRYFIVPGLQSLLLSTALLKSLPASLRSTKGIQPAESP